MSNGVEYYEMDDEDYADFEEQYKKKKTASISQRAPARQVASDVKWVFAGRPYDNKTGWAIVIGIFVAGIAVGVLIVKYGKKAMSGLRNKLG